MNYYIDVSKEMGRGLYAAHDLQAGKVLFSAELLVLSDVDTIAVNKTDLQYYTFKYTATQDCLVLGDGEIFNHNDTPNIGYVLQDVEGRKVMTFYLLKDVEARSQLFIDYAADTQADVSKYTINLY